MLPLSSDVAIVSGPPISRRSSLFPIDFSSLSCEPWAMTKPGVPRSKPEKRAFMELGGPRSGIQIPILHEDRSTLAIDKPAGWLLVPFSWQDTDRNLQAAIASSIAAGDYWARSRNIKFLRHVHRLDGETTGILLFGRSPGAVETCSQLFESRRISKRYLVVVRGTPAKEEFFFESRIGPDPRQQGRMMIDPKHGKESRTDFTVLARAGGKTLLEARPVTGRTHQIRVHLFHAGMPVVGDAIYGMREFQSPRSRARFPLALRAVGLRYMDPFQKWPVSIEAPSEAFLAEHGFAGCAASLDAAGPVVRERARG